MIPDTYVPLGFAPEIPSLYFGGTLELLEYRHRAA
jgi:hypothetical protein